MSETVSDPISQACADAEHYLCLRVAWYPDGSGRCMCGCACHYPHLADCGEGQVTVRCCNGCGNTCSVYTPEGTPLNTQSLPEPWKTCMVVKLVGGDSTVYAFPVCSDACAHDWIAKNGWRYVDAG